MANFRGGFAFNNEAAKVEVEQAPDGTLISCVNPVTGEGLNAGNSKEVITGTAAAPFGDYTVAELAAGLIAGDISIFANIDASALGISAPIKGPVYALTSGNTITMDGASFSSSPELLMAYAALWDVNNAPSLRMYNNGTVTDASAYMSAITSTVTIYHHPMP